MTSGAESPSTGWQVVDDHLRKTFRFADFVEAFAFMTKVALIAERMDHHPDWSNSYNEVVIDLRSHDVGAVTERDHQLAERIDALADA